MFVAVTDWLLLMQLFAQATRPSRFWTSAVSSSLTDHVPRWVGATFGISSAKIDKLLWTVMALQPPKAAIRSFTETLAFFQEDSF